MHLFADQSYIPLAFTTETQKAKRLKAWHTPRTYEGKALSSKKSSTSHLTLLHY